MLIYLFPEVFALTRRPQAFCFQRTQKVLSGASQVEGNNPLKAPAEQQKSRTAPSNARPPASLHLTAEPPAHHLPYAPLSRSLRRERASTHSCSMAPTMSRPPSTRTANGNGSSNGNVAASADPFYVFKECVCAYNYMRLSFF